MSNFAACLVAVAVEAAVLIPILYLGNRYEWYKPSKHDDSPSGCQIIVLILAVVALFTIASLCEEADKDKRPTPSTQKGGAE